MAGPGGYVNYGAWGPALADAADMYVIMLGTNDGNDWINCSTPLNSTTCAAIGAYKSNYTEMINTLKGLPRGPRVVTMIPPQTVYNYPVGYMNIVNNVLPAVIRSVASSNGNLTVFDMSVVVPVAWFNQWIASGGYTDGLHPSDKAYLLMAQAVQAGLYSLLGTPTSSLNLVFSHRVVPNYLGLGSNSIGPFFSNAAAVLSSNGNPNATAHLYSTLGSIPVVGPYHFVLRYPDLGVSIEWIQTSNPTTSPTVNGSITLKNPNATYFQLVSTPGVIKPDNSECTNWGGGLRSTVNARQNYAGLIGNGGNDACFFYEIGAYSLFGSGFTFGSSNLDYWSTRWVQLYLYGF
jgi:lysophospholipase L1-like esterase